MSDLSKRWYARIEFWTLIVVVASGILHYWLVDRPSTHERIASRRLIEKNIEASGLNRQLIEANLQESRVNKALLEANIEETKASTNFLKTSVRQIESETTKASQRLRLLRQRIDEARIIDGLVDSLMPNVSITLVETTVTGNSVLLDWRFKNIGRTSAIIEIPRVNLSRVPVDSLERSNTSLAEKSYSILEATRIGNIRPGQTIRGSTVVRFNAGIAVAGQLYYYVEFPMRGHLAPNSKSYEILSEFYDTETIEKKISFHSGHMGSFRLR